jgi:alkyl hydroperoxide reductase subunit AhpC
MCVLLSFSKKKSVFYDMHPIISTVSHIYINMFKFALAIASVVASVSAISLRPRFNAPTFKAKAVINEEFIDVSLNQYIDAKQWTVLLFYPFDFTFVCPTELISFSEKASEFSAINTQVLAISTDSHHTHLAWSRTPRSDGGVGNLNIPLVADTSKDISRAYGVLVDDKDDDMYGAALRGLFLVDPSGKIRSVQINDDAVGRSVDETLRLLQAFQWADSHQGEACPASWTPGQDTIKTNPNGAKEYFKSHF